jgi:hypothetical protein
MLHGEDEADLRVGEPELLADQRQQQVKRGGIPVGQSMAGGNQADFPDVLGARDRGSCGFGGGVHIAGGFPFQR